MSRGLEHLLSDLIDRKERHQQIADSCPDVDSTYRWNMSQIGDLEDQIDRVLNLLERD